MLLKTYEELVEEYGLDDNNLCYGVNIGILKHLGENIDGVYLEDEDMYIIDGQYYYPWMIKVVKWN